MVLSKITVNRSIEILNKKIASSNSVKLLGLTINNKPNFGSHINDLRKVASPNLKVLGKIIICLSYLSLTIVL